MEYHVNKQLTSDRKVLRSLFRIPITLNLQRNLHGQIVQRNVLDGYQYFELLNQMLSRSHRTR